MSFDALTLTGILFAVLYVGIYFALSGRKESRQGERQPDLFDIPECRN